MPSRDFSLHGAIDLGARQAAARKQQERRAQGGDTSAGTGGGGAATEYVVDVTDQTFNAEVVERSQSVPVLVDFWAEWCGPCKQLSPVLEKLAEEAAGKWILAKIDIDANPQLAAYMQQMGVRGIPFVAAVVAGQLLPFLNGAAPEAQVRQAIDQLFEALVKEGLLLEAPESGEPGDAPAVDPVRQQAEDALQRGDLDGARAAFEQMIARDPRDAGAKQGLAAVELSRRVRALDPERVLQEAAEKPGDVQTQINAADVEMASGRLEQAFERLLSAVRGSAGDDRDAARKHLLSLFEVLPPDDPRVTKARRSLQSALF
ncbi:putative thioredoxin [Actinomadura pelletieri DSM 43383]|uniref:Putative thioredoxin n=1 Tax=Actinomadura pelletieri DSM 43383 TaxID=1120940 RepID=A0A495QTE2_9ACTN|nr:tetratricopeptide repeat protein [Actinomadura pelletieri]RKS76794.1 putative thioredoxin [Actinomadura pelletieri DSM 43383]